MLKLVQVASRRPSTCIRQFSTSRTTLQVKKLTRRQQMQETYAAATSFVQTREEELREVLDSLRDGGSGVGEKFKVLTALVPADGRLTDAGKWVDFSPSDMETLVKNILLGLEDGQRDNGYAIEEVAVKTGRPLQNRQSFMLGLVTSWSEKTRQTPTASTVGMLMQHASATEAATLYQQFLDSPAGKRFTLADFTATPPDALDLSLLEPAIQLIRHDASQARAIIDAIPKHDAFVNYALTAPLYAGWIEATISTDEAQAVALLKELCQNTHVDTSTISDMLSATKTIIHYPTKLPAPGNTMLAPPPLAALSPFLETFAKQGKVAQFESLFHNLTPYFLTRPDDRAWYLRSLVFTNAARNALAGGNTQEAEALSKIGSDNLSRCIRNGSAITKQTLSEVALPSYVMMNRLPQFIRLCQTLEQEVPAIKGLFQDPKMQVGLAQQLLQSKDGIVETLWKTLDHYELGQEYTAPNGESRRRPCVVRVNNRIQYDTAKPIPVESRPMIVSNVIQGLCKLDRVEEAEQLLAASKTYYPREHIPRPLPALLPSNIPFGKRFSWLSQPFSAVYGAIMMAHARRATPGQKPLADGAFSELSHDATAPHVDDANLSGLPRVMQLFDDMQSHSLRPTTSTFNAMAIGFIRAGDYASVLQIYEVMRGAQVQLDGVTKAWMDAVVAKGEANDAVREAHERLGSVLSDLATEALLK